MKFAIHDDENMKAIASPEYNLLFNKRTGFTARWGKTKEDDPDWCAFGLEILDLEISTGECCGKCSFCYKENGTPKHATHHMTLETFRDLLDRMPVGIVVTLKDGQIKQFAPDEKVILVNGSVVLAKNLDKNMDIRIQ